MDRLSVDVNAYVPRWVRSVLAESRLGRDEWILESGFAAILLLDIAGFVETTNQLARRGPSGAEDISNLLSLCFGPLTDIIGAHGGDVIAFVGDGILAMWKDAATPEEASLHAARCGLALNVEMNRQVQAGQHQLRPRISIDVGKIHCCKFGGLYDRWHFVIVGPVLERLGEAYRKAKVGDVVLCRELYRTIRGHCEGTLSNEQFTLDDIRSGGDPSKQQSRNEAPCLQFESLVPHVVVDRLRFGEPRWLAEFRNVTVVYVSLMDLSFEHTFGETLQTTVRQVQRTARRFDSEIHKVIMDDKGFSVSLAFGLPHQAHEDDPQRGVEAALAIANELKSAGVRSSIGIASGKLFCGDYGGRERREYCLMGPAINMASRLMELAAGQVLCDAKTAEAVGENVSFSVLPPQHIKGSDVLVAAFRPVAVSRTHRNRRDDEIVGRTSERRELHNALQSRSGGAIVVRGEPGIGKSVLLDDLVTFARSQDIRVLRGFATSIERLTPYFAWRDVIQGLLGGGTPEQIGRIAHEKLSYDGKLLSWLPLLRDIVNVNISETALTQQIVGSARAACIEALAVALLSGSERSPPALIFEDLHWFDSASIHLLSAVARQLPNLLLVASCRPSPTGLASTEGIEFSTEINLSAMTKQTIEQLLCIRLRANKLPEDLVKFVYQQGEGNPFHCEELALALRDTGAVIVTRGACEVLADLHDPAKRSLPANLEGVIVSRIDELRVETQLLLKVASAIGGDFTAETAQAVYPGQKTLVDIGAMLDELAAQDFLVIEDRGVAANYAFRHAISQEVTYRLLSFAQRVALHKTIANVIERQHSEWLEPYYSRLAQHWERANEAARAIRYLELSAKQALRSYANRDAIRYVRRAFELIEAASAASNDVLRSEWEEILGDANNELADYEEAFLHFDRAMALLKQTSPRGNAGRVARVFANVLQQIRLRLWPSPPENCSAMDRSKFQRTAHIRERLAERHFFLNESLAVLDETLAALNLAERGGAAAEAISGYSALALGLGMSGLRGVGRYYRSRALRVANEVGSLPATARAHLLAAVFGYGTGEWELTERCARHALELYRQLGDRSRWHAPVTILAFSAILRGDLATAETLISDLETMASSDSTHQAEAWLAAAVVLLNLMRNRTDLDQLGRLSEITEKRLIRADKLLCLGILSSAFLQRQEVEAASEVAERGLAVLQEVDVVWGSYVYGVVGVAEVFLAQWAEEKGRLNTRSHAMPRALLACKHAARVTRMSPVCRPQALLLGGRAALLSRRPAKAQRLWKSAARTATKLQMPREIGLALFQIAQTRPLGDPERSSNLIRAQDILLGVGAEPDLVAVRKALSI
ncbi:AAA family ATPase [Bradyrhizobium liaoningense]|uniref:AAA family ATPase n=1 Tax=Bradyrhizobium liaoningense TaxID=43992 RepID=UPI001BA58CBB|nr:adenylate/guanylate cyclase domain-containing protein [Bradyrhizobium liaoningense]MBR0906607.1 AAA family ATPase [Bradyrhizobium liaoningense]